jgi:hypothetical protein
MAVKSRPLPRRKKPKPEAMPSLDWRVERLFVVAHNHQYRITALENQALARITALETALNNLVSKGQTP